MLKYTSNANEVITNLVNGLKGIEPLLDEIGDYMYNSVKDRIFNQGLDENNQSIGKYTNFTKKKRQKKGLQTSIVDLKFEGNLINSFTIQKGKYSIKVGVFDTKESIIAVKNEIHFGKKIFSFTEADFKQVESMVSALVDKIK